MMSLYKKEGFTLIELLIVVAIIAILAAIAIPNFLEAQTRAKYSRCFAETDTLAKMIMAYSVDWNEYVLTPLNGNDPCINSPVPEGQWLRLIPLTTPVAYITSLPIDPFDAGSQGIPANNWLIEGAGNDTYNYQNIDFCEDSMNDTTHPLFGSRFKVLSPGLSRQPYPVLWAVPYDPSNGTVSLGVCGETDRGRINGDIFNYDSGLVP
jgi:prepilin-type N-terminal cleavage/methylation domain-containing protein